MWVGGWLKGGVLVGCVAVWNQSSESIRTGPRLKNGRGQKTTDCTLREVRGAKNEVRMDIKEELKV